MVSSPWPSLATVSLIQRSMLRARKTAVFNLFLGGVGAGDFFLGHKQIGFIKVAVTVVLNVLLGDVRLGAERRNPFASS